MAPSKKSSAKKTSVKKRATSAKKRGSSAKKRGSSAKKRASSAKKRTTSATAPPRTSAAARARDVNRKAIEDAAARIRALNEQILTRSQAAGIAYVDAYERALGTIAGIQERMAEFAESGRAEWLATFMKAQADLTRELTETVTAAFRQKRD